MTTNQETKEQHPGTNNTSLRRKCKKEDRAKRERDNIINKEARDNTNYQESKERSR